MSTKAQALTIAMFGAYAGGYTADIEGRIEAFGLAGAANSLVGFQTPLLGLNLTSNSTWVDLLLSHFGITAPTAAYDEASSWAASNLQAGASRGEIVAAAIEYLLGDNVAPAFAAIAEAFVASVEAGVEWSAGDGAEVLSIVDLRAEAGFPPVATVFNLTAALATLTAAQEAEASAFAAVAEFVGTSTVLNATAPADANDNGTVTAAELAAYVGAFGGNDVATAVDAAEAAVNTAEAALASDRAGTFGNIFNAAALNTAYSATVMTDARLNAALAAAQKNLAEDAAAKALAATLATAKADLAADVAKNGTDAALLAALRDALTAAVQAGDIFGTTEYELGGDTVNDVLAAIAIALDPSATAASQASLIAIIASYHLAPEVDESDEPGFEVRELIAARAALIEDVEFADNAYEANPSVQDVRTVEGLIETREELIADLAAKTEYAAALAELAAAYDAAADALADAEDALADNDWVVGVIGTDNATADNDVFIFDGETGGTIALFGAAGTDVIFFGDQTFALVEVASTVDIGATNVGSASAFEIFWQQVGTELRLFVEVEAFGGNSTNGVVDLVQITLTGFNASQIDSFNGQFLVAAA